MIHSEDIVRNENKFISKVSLANMVLFKHKLAEEDLHLKQYAKFLETTKLFNIYCKIVLTFRKNQDFCNPQS